MFALCAGLVAAGALGTAYAFTSVNDTQEVLVVSRDINRGETIEAGDLSVVRVSVDPAMSPVAGSQKGELEGRRAATDLWAGTLLTEQAVTDSLVPVKGQSLVGISLTPAQMPSESLYSGDSVRIVTTPGDQGEVTNEDPVTIEAVVVGVSRAPETGETVVDVSVPEGDAADLAARAATGRVALVLDTRER
ncbi:SAF domain-containing protein [Nocardioides sp.]|uniref:SAF domain-containing protein n=1 Tax=Nocardioides sp. TaxID=35761 RepID=UPI002736B08E|nr:SAF domain-containing protein [Nocardioides sp.]MDP3891971.1 SAF domain-containing protein [Nocardioides sp.]